MPTPRQIEQTAPLPTGPGQQTNLNSGQFRLRNSAKILVLVSTCVPGFECVPVTIDSLKCHCKFTYQDERTKFERVLSGPRTTVWALLRGFRGKDSGLQHVRYDQLS